MNEREASAVMSRADADGSDAGGEPSTDDEELRRATGLAVAAAGISIFGFVSLFRLRVGWDQSRGRAFRRFFGVQAESLAGIALGYRALNRLRNASADKRGVPFAVLGIVLGVSNVARAVFWLRQDRPEL
jgi:hypothetical protein